MEAKVIERTAEAAVKTAEVGLTERQIYNRLRKLEAVEAQIKALEAEKASIRAQIIGEAEEVMIDNAMYSLSYKTIISRRFDSKAFSAVHPDLYEAFRSPQASSRFTYKFK